MDNSTLTNGLHTHLPAPASFKRADLGVWVLFLLLFMMMAVLGVPVGIRWREICRATQKPNYKSELKVQRRLVFWVVVNVFSTIANCVSSTVLSLSPSSNKSLMCDIQWKNAGFWFSVSAWGAYWVLVVRAEAALDTNNKTHMLVFKLCRLGLKFVMPGFIVATVALFKGRVLFNETCTLGFNGPVFVVFTMIDSVLSVLLMLVFYIPVRQHLSEAPDMTPELCRKNEHIHRMVVRSLRLSVVQMSSTFFIQVLGFASLAIASDEDNPEYSYLRRVRTAGYALDMCINTLCTLGMSSAWVPKRWLRLSQRVVPTRIMDTAVALDSEAGETAAQ